MARVLTGAGLWQEIRRRSRRSKTMIAVVGYLGRHPRELLRWPRRSTVICDLSRVTVARGSSSARGAIELRRKGVNIYSVRMLHAKVYIFDSSAIVASANLSAESARLVEAGVLLTDPPSLKRLRVFANRLRSESMPRNDEKLLRELAKLEPRRRAIFVAPGANGPPPSPPRSRTTPCG